MPISQIEALERRSLLAAFNPLASATDGAVNSLRAAIIAANANSQNDTISLQSGTYLLTVANSAGQENNAAQGDLDLKESGKSVTIQGNGAGITFINANGIDRAFEIFNNVTVVFKNLTITGGTARDDGSAGASVTDTDAAGGGILSLGGKVTLDHVTVS